MLKEGDIIELKNGHKVYAEIPEMFVYDNRRFSNKLTSHDIIIGEIYENRTDISHIKKWAIEKLSASLSYEGIIVDKEKSAKLINEIITAPKKETWELWPGKFVVYKTNIEGGGSGHNDSYPDGHRVYCENIDTGVRVNFYETGCFTAMIEGLIPIGKAKLSYEL